MRLNGLLILLRSYFFDRRRWWLWFWFIVLFSAYIINIKLAVALNEWNGRFFNALQTVDKNSIYHELFYFIFLAAAIIILLVSAGYLKDRLILILRRDITYEFFNRWMSNNSAHFFLKESNREPDNPDQRMTEDIRIMSSLGINLSVSLFDSLLTIGNFSIILWKLSGSVEIAGYTIHGYMFWVCVFYTLITSYFTHLIGRKIKFFNIHVQRSEADLRTSLIEKRQHADAIAGAHGESFEIESLKHRFDDLMQMLIALIKRQRNLNYFTVGVGQFTHLAPIFFSLPSFFAGQIQLGGLMQVRGAFNDVARSLSWFILAYDDLAMLAAALERLGRLEEGLRAADQNYRDIASRKREASKLFADIKLEIPSHQDNKPSPLPIHFNPPIGSFTIVTGPSGEGKSTLLKALAGFYGHYKGIIECPTHLFWLPQKSYLFKGSLRANLAYPSSESRLSTEVARNYLNKVGLSYLCDQLNAIREWSTVLSGGEQQRICLIRVFINQPKLALLDESLSALDSACAKNICLSLQTELPYSTIILVTHQKNLITKQNQVLTLNRNI